jgi:hypothetical protein
VVSSDHASILEVVSAWAKAINLLLAEALDARQRRWLFAYRIAGALLLLVLGCYLIYPFAALMRTICSIFHIKLNDNPRLPENTGKLCCARARGHNAQTRFRGEDFIMTDDDSKTLKATYQRDRDLQRRGVKIDDAIQGLTDDDRKMIINKSLRKVNSALSIN